MKKVAIAIIIVLAIFSIFIGSTVYATTDEIIDEKTESKLIEIKENTQRSLDYYKEQYGNDAYGITAYILNLVRIYSIPLCFLGIAVSGVYQFIIGIRKLDTQEKGLTLMVTFVTLAVICQILPLVFAVVVKFGRR